MEMRFSEQSACRLVDLTCPASNDIKSLQDDSNILFLKTKSSLSSEELGRLKSFSAQCNAKQIALFVTDSILLAKQINATGVVFYSKPESYERAREVLGPSALIGRVLKEPATKHSVATEQGAEQLDFFYIASSGRFESNSINQASPFDAKSDRFLPHAQG